MIERRVRREWDRLCAATSPPGTFDPTMVADLPEPARRWLTHAIAPGTPLWRSVELAMCGEIRLGAWRPFTATQVLAPPDGYIWAATARVFGLPVVGYDRLSSSTAEMRWRLLRVVPVMTARGADIVRSAAGRLAGECVLVPTTFRAAAWTAGSRPDTAVAAWRIRGGEGPAAHGSRGAAARRAPAALGQSNRRGVRAVPVQRRRRERAHLRRNHHSLDLPRQLVDWHRSAG